MAAARKVAVYTTIGETTYAPGDEVPADEAALVDNDAVWEAPVAPEVAPKKAAAKRPSK